MEINLLRSTEILFWFDTSKKLYQDSVLSELIIKISIHRTAVTQQLKTNRKLKASERHLSAKQEQHKKIQTLNK